METYYFTYNQQSEKEDMFYLTIGILTRDMTSRTYNMQTQAEMGVVNPPQALVNNLSPRHTSVFVHRDIPLLLMGHNPVTGLPTASHSDVVCALRPPSPRKETTALILAHSLEDADIQRVPDRSLNEILANINRDNLDPERIGTVVTVLASSEVELEKITLEHKHCVCSLGSKIRTRNASKEKVHIVLQAPIKKLFRPEAAMKRLTAIEKLEWTSKIRL